jgi:hypothetical protein
MCFLLQIQSLPLRFSRFISVQVPYLRQEVDKDVTDGYANKNFISFTISRGVICLSISFDARASYF